MNPTRKNRTSCAVRKLSSQAEQAAAQAPDPLADLSRAIKIALQGETDPYVMLGVNKDGVTQAQAAANHSPEYFVNEAALVTGVRALSMLALDYLPPGAD